MVSTPQQIADQLQAAQQIQHQCFALLDILPDVDDPESEERANLTNVKQATDLIGQVVNTLSSQAAAAR